jgi:hypothetical protein
MLNKYAPYTNDSPNITPVLSGIPIEGENGVVTKYGVQMMRINIPSAALVIATGTNPTGEQM